MYQEKRSFFEFLQPALEADNPQTAVALFLDDGDFKAEVAGALEASRGHDAAPIVDTLLGVREMVAPPSGIQLNQTQIFIGTLAMALPRQLERSAEYWDQLFVSPVLISAAELVNKYLAPVPGQSHVGLMLGLQVGAMAPRLSETLEIFGELETLEDQITRELAKQRGEWLTHHGRLYAGVNFHLAQWLQTQGQGPEAFTQAALTR